MDKISTGTFKITESFKIVARGLVLAGEIASGFVNTKDFIEFSALGQRKCLQIKGVELIRRTDGSNNFIGLVIGGLNQQEIDELRNWTPDDTIALIYKAAN